MILVTSHQNFLDFPTIRRFSAKRMLILLLPVMVFFCCVTEAEASSHNKMIQTDNISMTGNRQTETATTQKIQRAFKEKIIVTKPIVFTGSRKISP